MRAYVVTVVTLVAAGLAAVGSFNAAVDPFGVLPSPEVRGWNVPKTELRDRARLAKAHAVRWLEPTALILGASTSLIGLDPDHPGWRSERPYNLALPGGTIYECRRYLEHAAAVRPPERVVLGLDLPMFNVHLRTIGDYDESRLLVDAHGRPAPGKPLEPLFVTLSQTALVGSVRTLRHNANAEPGTIVWADGRFDMRAEPRWVRDFGGVRGLFADLEKLFLWRFFFPPPAREFRLEDPESGLSSLEEVERIVALARRHGTELHLILSPTHVRLREVIHAAGLGDAFAFWVRSLTRIAAAGGVPLTDFSGYHALTTEELPPPGGGSMHGYFDPAHYKTTIGNLVLDRVLGYEASGREIPEDFGVRLTPDNVEEQLASATRERERYRRAHAAEVAEIEEWGRRAAASRDSGEPLPGGRAGEDVRARGEK